MKIPKALTNYIEYELNHFEQYKKELLLERERILESYSCGSDFLNKTTGGSIVKKPTEEKAVRLLTGTAALSLEWRVEAIERMLEKVSPAHKEYFDKYFVRKNKNMLQICQEMYFSKETFHRYKREIIAITGIEMGLIRGFLENDTILKLKV